MPTFMKWPGVIAAGADCDTSITSVDFLPTFAALAKADLPRGQPVDGVSLVPLMKGEAIDERAIYWHFPLDLEGQGDGKVWPIAGTSEPYWRGVPASMIRRGEWKLIEFFEDGRTLLLNITKDPGEAREVSADHPEVARRLHAELDAWQEQTKADIPSKLNPDFDPEAKPRPGKE